MVDVGGKPVTLRRACAEGRIQMQPAALELIVRGAHAKGDVLGIARVAGILAAKKTAELIPLCHHVPLSKVEIELEVRPAENAVYCRAQAEARAQTGVEMEALIAVEIALLTLYDMCKSVDRGMTLDAIRLLEKSGGTSGEWRRDT